MDAKMNGTIFDIKRFAVHDGPGIRTTVFFKGCPLHCIWCHNPESIHAQKQFSYLPHKCVSCGECTRVCPTGAQTLDGEHRHVYDREKCALCGKCVAMCPQKALTLYGYTVTVEELLPILEQDRDFFEESGGGVTLSGGEALLQASFCAELLKRLKEDGIHTAVDTSGFVSKEALQKVIPYTDIFLYDIKHMDSETHRRLTGQPNELILENLKMLSDAGSRVEIRMPFVPEHNDSEENLRAAGEFLAGLKGITRIKVLPYHEYARNKYTAIGVEDTMPHVKMPDEADVDVAVELLRSYGLNAVSGNKA